MAMTEREEEEEKKKLDLNWNVIFRDGEQGPPLDLVVVGSSDEQYATTSETDWHGNMSNHALKEKIDRIRSQLDTLSAKLPDKGAKLRKQLQGLQDEQDRRTKLRFQKKAEELQKPTQSQNSHSIGGSCNGSLSEAPSSQTCLHSLFTKHFSEKLEKKQLDCTTHITPDAFCSEFTWMGRGSHKKTGGNSLLPSKRRKRENQISSRQSPFPCSRSSNDEKHRTSSGAKKFIAPSNFYQPLGDGKSSCRFPVRKPPLPKSKLPEGQTCHNSRTKKNQTVVVVDEEDEEDCEVIRTSQQEEEPIGRMEAKIYYPSRDDPESVELCYSDIKCLAPEAFLKSTIMNFYIRYLRRPVSATGRLQCHYHFFNTYFYEKLKEAISYKGNDEDSFFLKFRRWWKGVNIFQKAYIFFPIHESLHWSLVIICIPDKEDETGPIILHLDSLGFHNSSQIFQNVRSFLRREWNYLEQTADPPNVPIAENIWKHLPRRVEEKIITVPQQKNDYDCGIFVLYFIERFIQEAPDRLRKRDLAMFSRQWFKPEEASGLRKRIRNLLLEEFENTSSENEIMESSPTSSDLDPL